MVLFFLTLWNQNNFPVILNKYDEWWRSKNNGLGAHSKENGNWAVPINHSKDSITQILQWSWFWTPKIHVEKWFQNQIFHFWRITVFKNQSSNQVYWSKQLHLRAKTIYRRTSNGVEVNHVREDGASVSIQVILEAGHCRSFSDVCWQSIPRSGRTNSKRRFPTGKINTWLTDLEVVPSEVTSNWRFKELLRWQAQVTVEQLIHRDESST